MRSGAQRAHKRFNSLFHTGRQKAEDLSAVAFGKIANGVVLGMAMRTQALLQMFECRFRSAELALANLDDAARNLSFHVVELRWCEEQKFALELQAFVRRGNKQNFRFGIQRQT